MIFTHPNNKHYIEEMAQEGDYDRFSRFSCTYNLSKYFGEEIIFNEIMNERDIIETWHPPDSTKFIEYEYSDEDWMKPLGLGRIESVDKGPLFLKIQNNMIKKINNLTYGEGLSPPSMIHTINPYRESVISSSPHVIFVR